jgi:hypothetical protein
MADTRPKADVTKGKGMWRAAEHDRGDAKGRLRSYLHHTAGPLTGFLMGFPLSLIYTVGMAIRGPTDAGDFFTKLQFDVLGGGGYLAVQAGLALTFLICIWAMQRKGRFEWRYFGPLLVESTVYAAIVILIMHFVEGLLGLEPHHTIHPTREAAVLAAFGEAVNEETFFRWLMVPGVLYLLKKIGVRGEISRGAAGLAVATVIYALIGYFTGSGMGETRTGAGFLTFLVVGFVFNGLFLLRGYTIVAYTHLLYAIYWAFTAPLVSG